MIHQFYLDLFCWFFFTFSVIFIGIGITGKDVFPVEHILLNRMVISWIDGEADHKGLQDCLGHIPGSSGIDISLYDDGGGCGKKM